MDQEMTIAERGLARIIGDVAQHFAKIRQSLLPRHL